MKLIAGLLAADAGILAEAKDTLRGEFGAIDRESAVVPFTYTAYYNKEMGCGIVRQYLSFEALIAPDVIAHIKLKTNEIEGRFAAGGCRKANIDPGYVDLSKLVLATTKDATYRVYIGGGIYAQSTLFFKDNCFEPWPWTYPDYRAADTVAFFNAVRGQYKKGIKEVGSCQS
ncbi:MAG TPA: DUF4416 family protein [bacterium]|nr:DUF4416 family protein [bacterium]